MVLTAVHVSRAVAAALLLAAVSPAAAQWAWRDDNGRVVYSDRPPPASVKADQIIRQGNAIGAPPAQSASASSEAKDDRPKTMAEREMEFRKRQQERAEAERKAADEAAQRGRKAAECERARGYLRALEDGHRVARTDAQGNREFLDESQRAAETARMRDMISKSCS